MQKRARSEDVFPPGAITALAMENFMTYDQVKIVPGPGLNVVVGPNGSGKSSIVAAICLGLAGNMHSTGRATREDSYIKEGASFANIEIELNADVEGNRHVIKRTITKKGNGAISSWTLDRKKVTEIKVKELIRNLNIQVDNLCQFLAQERVCQFTGLNPQTLLKETEKAISDSSLFQQHEELIELGKNARDLDFKIKNHTDQVESLRSTIARLEEQVDRITRRKELQEKLEILQKKKPWIEAELAQKSCIALKEVLNEAKARLDSRLQEMSPIFELKSYLIFIFNNSSTNY
jgi:chromosome segregation ATPase